MHDPALLLQEILRGYVLPWNGYHGVVHWARVLENGLRVAEQHGGGIEWCRVESRTRFILRLPSSIVCGAPASPEKLA
jgi:hypothetical protein